MDLASLIDMFNDPEVMRYIGPRGPMTEAEIQNWLAEILHRQDSERTRYAVASKATDELIGVADPPNSCSMANPTGWMDARG